jgi:hypothetical protein
MRVWKPFKLMSRPMLGGRFPGAEPAGLDAIIDVDDLPLGLRADAREQLPAVIAHSHDELRFLAHLAEQGVVAAELHLEILCMRRETERDAGNPFQEDGGVRGAIREMDVEMVDAPPSEPVGEKERIPGAGARLVVGAVADVVAFDELGRPFLFRPGDLLPHLQHGLLRRVGDPGLQVAQRAVPDTVGGRVDRSDGDLDALTLQGEHLRETERLRDDGKTGVEVGYFHAVRGGDFPAKIARRRIL